MRYEVIVVGAGHAGIEAALASARMGRKTACVTLNLERIGHLPCNCSVGGPAKGHIAREVDALGGQMAVTTDYTLTHIRKVGTGKGPAVQTLRAHVCKLAYPEMMQQVMRSTENLTLIEGMADRIETTGGRVSGLWVGEQFLEARSIVLTTGTFLNGLCHEGSKKTVAARHGDKTVVALSDFLQDLGVRLRRFKTGTTPRIRFSSIDKSMTEPMESETDSGAMSFLHDAPMPTQALLSCYQTRTNPQTHALLADRLHESAMYSGQIEGVGPRYCPSIEDKIVRFADKDSHPIFLEIEDWEGESVYVQGFSTSLPAATQLDALRTIRGLENVEMTRPGYAVEYDMADPQQLDVTMMSKLLPGLFLAGQLNGTSGYEEAAGQGIAAGINAALNATDQEMRSFSRSNSFIGVMIDDLVTKGVDDPYRMLTARAEHRLVLRHDNADQRLTPIAREIGLCDDTRWKRFSMKMDAIQGGVTELSEHFTSSANVKVHENQNINVIKNKVSLLDLLRRPEVSFDDVAALASALGFNLCLPESVEVRDQIELEAKYAGYIDIQRRAAEQSHKLDSIRIPVNFEFQSLPGLSYESIDKLSRVRPTTVGQASRVSGVRPSDVALLIGHLNSRKLN